MIKKVLKIFSESNNEEQIVLAPVENEIFQVLCSNYSQFKKLKKLLEKHGLEYKAHIPIQRDEEDKIKELVTDNPLFFEIILKSCEFFTFFDNFYQVVRDNTEEITALSYKDFMNNFKNEIKTECLDIYIE